MLLSNDRLQFYHKVLTFCNESLFCNMSLLCMEEKISLPRPSFRYSSKLLATLGDNSMIRLAIPD